MATTKYFSLTSLHATQSPPPTTPPIPEPEPKPNIHPPGVFSEAATSILTRTLTFPNISHFNPKHPNTVTTTKSFIPPHSHTQPTKLTGQRGEDYSGDLAAAENRNGRTQDKIDTNTKEKKVLIFNPGGGQHEGELVEWDRLSFKEILEMNLVPGNAIVNKYMRKVMDDDALQVFDEMPLRILGHDTVALAVCHSARVVYQMLLSRDVDLAPKDFAVDLRIKHPQNLINNIQFAELVAEVRGGRGKTFTGEFVALTGARLSGKELVTLGLSTQFVPSEKLPDLEKQLVSLNKGDLDTIESLIEQFSSVVQIDADSILNRQPVIDECFSKESVEEITKAFEAALFKEGNGWIGPVLKGLKRSSPTGLKITLKSGKVPVKQIWTFVGSEFLMGAYVFECGHRGYGVLVLLINPIVEFNSSQSTWKVPGPLASTNHDWTKAKRMLKNLRQLKFPKQPP